MENQLISNRIHEDLHFEGVFLLDKNLKLEPDYKHVHSHNIYEIGIVVNGNGVFILNDKIYPFNKGDITITVPGDMHISNSSDEKGSTWNYVNINLNTLATESPNVFLEILSLLSEKTVISGVYSRHKYPRICQYVYALIDELDDKKYCYQEVSYHLLANLFVELCRNSRNKVHHNPIDYKKYQMISPALSFIVLKYSENITSKQLADMCFISETHIRRLFQDVLKLSPMDYVYKTRITAGKSLLKTTDLTITEISQMVGYQTQTSFNKHFKRFTNTTPTQYRKSL